MACLRYLKGRCKSLRAIAIDMSDAYRKAIRQVFAAKVDVVHDPYHVVALANKAIDQTRRTMMRKLETGRKQLLKGTRFLLLRGLENLNERSLEHLMQLMEINEPLYQAYLLKEEIRHFWNLPDSAAGNAFLDAWIEQACSIATSSSPGSPAPFTGIAPACSTTSNTASQPDRSKDSTTRLRSSKDEPMVSETWTTSSSTSTSSMRTWPLDLPIYRMNQIST